MIRRFWAWWTRPIVPPAESELVDRIGAVELTLVSFLADQGALADPDDRNVEAIDLVLDVAGSLGIQLPRLLADPAVPVSPGGRSEP